MGWLEKEFILHERDENGKLLPVTYPVPELGGREIQILPVTRGEVLRITQEAKDEEEPIDINKTISVWEKFVADHVLKPKFTTEELRAAKPIFVKGVYKDILNILIDAIYKASGIETVEKAEEKIKKK